MDSLQSNRPADTQFLHSPTDLTSSSGPPSATSTRETSPASSPHYTTSTNAPASLDKASRATAHCNHLDMTSSEDQSLAAKEALQDDKRIVIDTHFPGKNPNSSASLSRSEMIMNPNDRSGHTTGHWQNSAAQDIFAIRTSSRAVEQSLVAIDDQKIEAAQSSGRSLGLRHEPKSLAEESVGKPGEPYTAFGVENFSDTGVRYSSDGDTQALQVQGNRHLHDTHENTPGARSLNIGQPQRSGTGRESCLGFRPPQGILRAQTLCKTHADNDKGESQGLVPDWNLHNLPHAYSTREGHSTPRATWNPYNVSEPIAEAEVLLSAPANDCDSGRENHLPLQELMTAQSLRDLNSYGNVLVPRNPHSRFAHYQPVSDSYHGPANVYNAGGQNQSLQHCHKDIPAASYYHNAYPNNWGAKGQGQFPPEGNLSAQNVNNNQNNVLAARGLPSPSSNRYDAGRHEDLAPQKPCDAHRNNLAPETFRRITSQHVFDEHTYRPAKAGSSGCVSRCLPTLHNSSATSGSAPSTNFATAHHSHTKINNFPTSITPGFSSPVSSIFGINGPLAVGSSSYISITSPCTTDSLRNKAGNIATSSRRFEPLTDTSSSADPSPPSESTASSSPNTDTATMIPPRGIVISDADMERAMAYCFDRGNGQYTRLVPVDVLPFSLRDLPARVSSDEGMIILPVPRMVGPDGQPANVQPILHVAGKNVTPPVSPTGITQDGATDLIQNHIDNIVAAAPRSTSGSIVLTRSAAAAAAAASCTGRREKVYCDKWIHDGTCAFTQQGCKFKHEMPMDRETQQSLGLFHGLPAWYRKQEAERVMHLDDRPVPLGGGAVGYYGRGPADGLSCNNGGGFGAGMSTASRAQNWRRIEAAPPIPGTAGDNEGSSALSGGSSSRGGSGRGRNGSRVANYRTNNNFGPIGPPSQSTGTLSGSLGGDRRRKNTITGLGMFPVGETSGLETQRDGAALRGGMRLANNPFDALEDYGSASNAGSSKGNGSDQALD